MSLLNSLEHRRVNICITRELRISQRRKKKGEEEEEEEQEEEEEEELTVVHSSHLMLFKEA
jgi:hypothetical protein